MSRLFNGSTDLMSYGTFPRAMTGTLTMLAVIKAATASGFASILEGEDSGGTTRSTMFRNPTQGEAVQWSNGVAAGPTPGTMPVLTDTASWGVVAVSRLTGTTTTRGHRSIFGGSDLHGDSVGTMANAATMLNGTLRIGGNDDFFNHRVAAVAIWDGVQLTDGQIDGIKAAATTQSIADLSPNWLADDSDAFATNLVNPGTGDRTAISGTADDADDPPSWVYGIVAPVIPITVVGAGAVTFGAAAGTTVAPPIPTHAAGDLLVAVRAMKHSTTETLTAEAGWTRGVAEQAGGAGSFAADTGPTKIAVDYLQATGAGTTVTFDNTAVANTVAWAQVIVFRKNIPGANWSLVGVSGTDNSAGAAYSVAFASNPGFELGDYAVVGVSTPTDITAAHWSTTVGLTATGLTAVITEQGDAVSGNGFDIGAGTWTAQVTAGPATAVPTFAATASGTTTNIAGPCALLRVRADATPTLAMSAPRR